MPRLRRSDPASPGISRRRRGREFHYVDAKGNPVRDAQVLARIDSLVIPPAWQDVWICPYPNGHIQAIGTDAAGRRQYRYHDEWRRKRDLEKFDRILEFADLLPAMRDRIAADLALPGMPKQRVLACAARLLDIGYFRIGSEEYAEQNQTFGLATIRRDHTAIDTDGTITIEFTAKSGKKAIKAIGLPDVVEVLTELLVRDDPNEELLAYWQDGADGGWVDVKSWDINNYLREISGGAEVTAKDFRTWAATGLCAVALAVSESAATSPTAIKRAITRAVQETADYLGNTPAVCRSSYIHPRVLDLFAGGVTISEDLEGLGDGAIFGQPAYQGAVETAVRKLLRNPEAARAAKRRQRMVAAAAARSSQRSRAGTRGKRAKAA